MSSTLKSWWLGIPVFVSLTLTFAAHASEKVCPFSELTGPYPVGTTQYTWVDPSRPERYTSTPGAKRVVIVQAWYPAQKGAAQSAEEAPYLLSPQEFSGTTPDAVKLTQVNQLAKTRSLLDAPLAMEKSAYPVLIFNPGGGNSRFTSSFVTEQLASHGFIVLAIEHLGDGMSTHLPDGTPLKLDRIPRWNDPEIDHLIETHQASADQIVRQARIDWAGREQYFFQDDVNDSKFVLRRLEVLNASKSARDLLAHHMDLSRIGTLGWSQGGATSISLLVHDPRVRAAVDLDGQLFGPDKATLKTDRPFMLLHSVLSASPADYPEMAQAEATLSALTNSWNDYLVAHSTGPRYEAGIRDTDHGSFSDWRIFFSYTDPAKRAAARAREQIISRLTVSFFQRYLLGEAATIPMSDPLVVNGKVLGPVGERQ